MVEMSSSCVALMTIQLYPKNELDDARKVWSLQSLTRHSLCGNKEKKVGVRLISPVTFIKEVSSPLRSSLSLAELVRFVRCFAR